MKCHRADGEHAEAAKRPLTAETAYDMLVAYGKPSLQDHVRGQYREGKSREGHGAAATSALLAMLAGEEGHHGVKLSDAELERLIVWMDTYGQRLGTFDERQEQHLVELREQWQDLLAAASEG